MKGQIWSIDFIVSVVIMIAIIIPALFLYQNLSTQSENSRMLVKAENDALKLTDAIVNTGGVPSDWNSTTVASVGLAKEMSVLSETLVSRFNATNYSRLKAIFGYDFYIAIEDINGTVYYQKGISPPASASVVPVRRAAILNDRIVKLDFYIWY